MRGRTILSDLAYSKRTPSARTLAAVAAAFCVIYTPVASAKVTPGVPRVPLQGWNTWCTQNRCTVDWCTSSEVLDVARTIKDLGMIELGWDWIALDDCWGVRNSETHEIEGDPSRFPEGMPAFIDKVHALGFKFGLYTDWGPNACHSPFTGSWPYYAEDTNTFAKWGVDMVKLDGCNPPPGQAPEQLARNFSSALAATGAPIWMYFHCWHTQTCAQYGNSFRVYDDHHDEWASTASVVDYLREQRQPFWGPGPNQGFPDPDFIFTGGEGCGEHSGPGVRCPGQSEEEYRSEFALFSIGGGQLIFATDPRNMTGFMKSVLMNQEILAVFQDTAHFDNITVLPYQPSSSSSSSSSSSCSVSLEQQLSHDSCALGKSFGCYDGRAEMYTSNGCRGVFTCDGVKGVRCDVDGPGTHDCPCVPQPTEAWARPLSGKQEGCVAVVLYNPGEVPSDVGVDFQRLPGVRWGPGTKATVRDLWAHQDEGQATGSYIRKGVPAHGNAMVTLCEATSGA